MVGGWGASEILILEKLDKSRVKHVLKGSMKRETNRVLRIELYITLCINRNTHTHTYTGHSQMCQPVTESYF